MLTDTKRTKKLIRELKKRHFQLVYKPFFNIVLRVDEHRKANEDYMLEHIDSIRAITESQWLKK